MSKWGDAALDSAILVGSFQLGIFDDSVGEKCERHRDTTSKFPFGKPVSRSNREVTGIYG